MAPLKQMEGRAAMPQHQWSEAHAPDTMPLMLHLHRAQGLAFAQAQGVWARHGLTSAEFDVLATLRNSPPPFELTPSQLQASVIITSGGLTKVMRQLEDRNLVTRSQTNFDQRIKPIKLSRKGKGLVEKAMAELAATSGAWIRRLLGKDEIGLLAELLQKIAEADGTDAA
jgi:DNA-binding MarR family transcriptional regulator